MYARIVVPYSRKLSWEKTNFAVCGYSPEEGGRDHVIPTIH